MRKVCITKLDNGKWEIRTIEKNATIDIQEADEIILIG
jgi:hypothetical protein